MEMRFLYARTAEGEITMACMCMECRFARVIEDENEKLLSVCCNRKSDNFLVEVSIAFDSCEFGMIDDYEEE